MTNTCFEGNCRGNSFAKRGHSKEKRSDCPLVTLCLVLDSSGFPKRSHVYEGNVSEPATLRNVLLNRHYYGEIEDKRSRVRNTLLQIAEQKPISAQELLSSYCSLLYERHGSYEEVS